MRGLKAQRILSLALILLIMAILPVQALGEAAAQATAPATLDMPAITQTDCEWDVSGNLISETARTTDGTPAVNSRGFHQALYTWDEQGNLLTEAYYDLNGALVATDAGHARAEYTYAVGEDGQSRLLTEDRYAPDGSRADIPGGYSYRRDSWDGDQLLSSEYFNAAGNLTQPTGGFAQILCDISIRIQFEIHL